MDFDRLKAILKRAQDTYGYKNQMSVVAEECCELGKECNKYVRYPNHEVAERELRDKILTEVADMIICLNHLYMMFDINPEECEKHVEVKLDRLERWLDSSSDMYQTTIDREVEEVEFKKL